MEVSSASDQGDQVRVKRQTLQAVLEQCQRAMELLRTTADPRDGEEVDEGTAQCCDSETDELCDLLRSRVESPEFLEKLGSIHMSVPNCAAGGTEECSTWDVISKTDLWEGENINGENGPDQEDYVVVRQEDIVDGIACFMAAYLLSLKQTKVASL
ncbi:hypothetical protein AMTR_s00135p00048880 [Amborella trichopoda]|uniref:Uncharacterized protein n=1 Tax=Amborella trichopoda TaxID=13333 RepID=W1P7E7_AMBTC|nr:hypothetical protein AMTR_s00135p00048880 [Amborella trichopoda]